MKSFFPPRSRASQGQAMTETLILLPVLLLLMLGASELSNIAVVSSKAEISARFAGLKLGYPERFLYQEAFPSATNPAAVADYMEWKFYDDSIDDGKFAALGEAPGVEADESAGDPDVTFHKFTRMEMGYTPFVFAGNDWNLLFLSLNMNMDLVHGSQATFDYDLPAFPYTKWQLLPQADISKSFNTVVDTEYGLHGDFVVLGNSLSGTEGEEARAILLAGAGIIPAPPTAALALVFLLYILPLLLP